MIGQCGVLVLLTCAMSCELSLVECGVAVHFSSFSVLILNAADDVACAVLVVTSVAIEQKYNQQLKSVISGDTRTSCMQLGTSVGLFQIYFKQG